MENLTTTTSEFVYYCYLRYHYGHLESINIVINPPIFYRKVYDAKYKFKTFEDLINFIESLDGLSKIDTISDGVITYRNYELREILESQNITIKDFIKNFTCFDYTDVYYACVLHTNLSIIHNEKIYNVDNKNLPEKVLWCTTPKFGGRQFVNKQDLHLY